MRAALWAASAGASVFAGARVGADRDAMRGATARTVGDPSLRFPRYARDRRDDRGKPALVPLASNLHFSRLPTSPFPSIPAAHR